jgi:hypothetical protein
MFTNEPLFSTLSLLPLFYSFWSYLFCQPTTFANELFSDGIQAQMMDNVEMAIQVGEAMEGQPFDLKV